MSDWIECDTTRSNTACKLKYEKSFFLITIIIVAKWIWQKKKEEKKRAN